MPMTQAQRRVLQRALTVAEKGPSLGTAGVEISSEDASHRARVWAETWIASAIADVLRVDSGELSSRELLYLHPGA